MNEMLKRIKETLFVTALGICVLTTGMLRMNKVEKKNMVIENTQSTMGMAELEKETTLTSWVSNVSSIPVNDLLPSYKESFLDNHFKESLPDEEMQEEEKGTKEESNKKEIIDLEYLISPSFFIYDGTEKKVSLVIKDGETILEEETDYTLFYENNVNAGNASVTIKGINNYQGEKTIYYQIDKKPQEITLEDFTIKVGEEKIVELEAIGDISYQVEEESIAQIQEGKISGLTAGTTNIIITVQGDENHQEAQKIIKVTVIKEKTSIEDFEGSIEAGEYIYNGEEIKPSIKLQKEDLILIQDQDYQLEYKNNIESGLATIKAIGINDYEGEIEINFTIKKATLSYTATDYMGIYDASAHTISIDCTIEGAKILYQNEQGEYSLEEIPQFSEVGTYTVNYKITAPNYEEVTSSNTVTIVGVKEMDSTLSVDNNVLKIKDYTFNATSLQEKFKLHGEASYTHLNSKKEIVTTDKLSTGDYFSIMANAILVGEYQISILGDANGDGKISSLDYISIKNHIMKTKTINGSAYLTAADANDDGKISALDYIQIKNYIMKGAK